jgi:hypothetical protein
MQIDGTQSLMRSMKRKEVEETAEMFEGRIVKSTNPERELPKSKEGDLISDLDKRMTYGQTEGSIFYMFSLV